MTDQVTEVSPQRTSRTRRQRAADALAEAGATPLESPPPSPPEVPLAPPSIPIAEPEAPPARIEEIERGSEPTLGDSPLRPHDVVQVIDPGSRLYGVFFAVGDVRGRKVHGYYLTEGRAKQHITVALEMIHPTGGQAKVRSANPCSPKWLSDNQ